MDLEINEKYAKIYLSALNKKAPDESNDEDNSDCEMVLTDGGDGWTRATPVNYDEEQLEFDAVANVILQAFRDDKDYVSWGDGAYVRKDNKNPLETYEGTSLKKYDPVQLLDGLGFIMGRCVFLGADDDPNKDNHIKLHFVHIANEEVRDYTPSIRKS